MTIGEAIMSPTRSYAPVIQKLLSRHREKIYGMVHCSGGGQSKCLRFGKNIHFIKDALMPVPPIFKAIQKASKTSDEEMFRVYNMGHRLELYCPDDFTQTVIECSESFGIKAKVIGRTETNSSGNKLSIHHNDSVLSYSHNT